jgi:hypothetical protein
MPLTSEQRECSRLTSVEKTGPSFEENCPAIEARDELLCELEKNRAADCNIPELVASNGQK